MSTEATPAPEAPKAPPAPVKHVEPTSEGDADPGVDLNAIIAKFQPQIAETRAAAQDAMLSGVIAGGANSNPAAPSQVPAAPPPATVQTPAPTEPPAEQPQLRARQLAALARMEAENRTLKAQLEARLAELDKPKAPPVSSVEELQRLALSDPQALARALKIDDAAGFAAQLMYSALGEDAPPELRKELADKQTAAKLAALEAQVKQQAEEAQQTLKRAQEAARHDAADREIFAFAKAVPAEMPFLAEESRSNSSAVYEGMCHIAAAMIGAGTYPSAREVAQLYEDQLRSDYERLSRAVKTPPAPAVASTPAPSQNPTSPLGTLNDADTRGRSLGAPPPENADDPRSFLEKARAVAQSNGYRW